MEVDFFCFNYFNFLYFQNIKYRHDRKLTLKLNKNVKTVGASESSNQPLREVSSTTDNSANLLPTRQFGVSLSFIKDNNMSVIPPIVSQCVEFLSQPDGT